MRDDPTYFAFIEALVTQDHAKVQEFLNSGVNLARVPLITCLFPLHEASVIGDCALMKILIQSAAGQSLINQFDDLSNTPLMVAVENRHRPMVEFLLQNGADVNAHEETKAGNNAIKTAVEKCNLEIVKLLLKNGADPLQEGWMRMTALDVAKDNAKKREGPVAGAILDLLLARK